jgi:hypothetical protein
LEQWAPSNAEGVSKGGSDADDIEGHCSPTWSPKGKTRGFFLLLLTDSVVRKHLQV